MSLSELTSSQAVRQALAEFDDLGRTVFLEKYGFGEAREYFVEHEVRLYDSKAIAGVAFGYQHPERGALRPSDFSGGEATVKAKLEELGFRVLVLSRQGVGASQDTSRSPKELERAFGARMIEIYQRAKTEAGYNATRFLSMVNEYGGLETARMLLNATTVSDGYTALWQRGYLDLTVEAVILEPQWSPLFTVAEKRAAISRLRKHGYEGTLPDL